MSLREWFRQIHAAPALAYSQFANGIVQPGDAVVTFNYDDSLERELKRAAKWDASQGYGFQLGSTEQPSDVRMLKLHGSINWLVSVFGGASGGSVFAIPPGDNSLGDNPIIHRSDLEFLGYENFSGHIYKGGGAFPCLVLPGRTKEFFYDTSLGREYGTFWDSLWSQASQVVKSCDKMVICGYSLLPVDRRARELLLQSARKQAQIEIISSSQSARIANDFKTAGFHTVMVSEERHFEDWVAREVERIGQVRRDSGPPKTGAA
jgi:hypothetical protein